jgi:hypothetical protein
MALEGIVPDISKVDASLQSHYQKGEDGQYYLQANGLTVAKAAAAKLEEFRTNNHALNDKIREMESRYKDLDPEDYKRTKQDLAEIQSGKGEKFGELLAQRTSALKAEYEDRLTKATSKVKDWEKKAGALEGQLHRVLIDNELQKVAAEAKTLPTALEDVLLRGRATFKIVEGKVVPVDGDGRVIYGADAMNPMTMQDWIKGLQQKAPHLFEGATGGGATGGRGANGGAGAIVLTVEQARNPAVYRAAKERAEKERRPLQIAEG